METIIVSLVCVALIVLGGMTMSQGFLSSVDSSTTSWTEMGERTGEVMRTELSTLSANLTSANLLEVALQNSGQTKLHGFDKWDVIVQYYDAGGSYHVGWLPYTEGSLGNNEWTVKGIYIDWENQTLEVFDPEILNPGENIVIKAQLDPPVGHDTTNLAVTSTPNGVSTSSYFSRF